MVELRGVHRQRAKSGVEYHYVRRGGPRFWKTGDSPIGSLEYTKAYLAAVEQTAIPDKSKFSAVITAYKASPKFKGLKPRTKKDYSRFLDFIRDKFGEAPINVFSVPESRQVALKWRNKWQGKQALYAWQVLRGLCNWARDNGHISTHHIHGGGNPYQQQSRADIIWTQTDIDRFCAVAPERVRRILITAVETGLRPGDAVGLTRFHAKGDTISIKTGKKGKWAHIPITRAMRDILDGTPEDQPFVLVNSKGGQLTEAVMTRTMKRYRDRAGLGDLRLYDCRGTFVTNCVLRKVPIDDIARATGWTVAYAHKMIDVYASLHPDPERIKEALKLMEKR